VPALNEFASSHADVETVAVTFDSKTDAEQFVKRFGLKWRVVADARDFIDQVGVTTYPTFAAIDSEGRLKGVTNGSILATAGGSLTSADIDAWFRMAVE
jgi:protein-disulfide isomerase-like protein with CxxC motif